MITKLTSAIVEIKGEYIRSVRSVVIEEARSGDWAIGGKAPTTAR